MIGSWPFSTAEQAWPVADCTAEGLSATLAIHKSGILKPGISDSRIKQAVDVILSFQNKDGGWSTYELSRAPKWSLLLNHKLQASGNCLAYFLTFIVRIAL
jgi:lanosterol synthase